ncbi:Do family serine endopeptidase [Saccharibacter sp. 17.LH.SD]|uniref:Do family serine endopeptidase n=1 Tax=Saccharibacter sp. 17.LH.SD TaxID=2689393 RepID=UPI00136FDBD9|nr:Do family serine endopeptidase [Saccharibacter sp. 17.LH.SD]MXV44927.1 Do family serine endopeptidase [Saccharibacter sp. 17.LH.SD]
MTSPSRLSLALLAALPVIGTAPLPALAQSTQIHPQMAGQGIPDFVQIVHQVKPAVVSITAHVRESAIDGGDGDDGPPSMGEGMPFPFPFPFQMMPMPSNRTVEARGSGFIISGDGYIVTNNHVINGATKVSVKLDDGTVLPAKIVGRDAKTDIALLRVKSSSPLPYIELGNSDEVQPGQWVVAVGNPYGLGGTVTAGIISALGRNLHSGPYNDFIQIDAPINRGNSGGPLITLDGKVVGVNSMIMSPNGGGSIGIGFAIPSSTVQSVVDQLRRNGHVVRGYLGIEGQDITSTMARALNLTNVKPGAPSHGALVSSVIQGGPADKAGVKIGDVVIAIDGHTVRNSHDLAVKVVSIAPGSNVTVGVLRDGKPVTLHAVVGNLSAHNQEETSNTSSNAPSGRLGISLAALTPRTRQELGLDESVQGAVVADIAQGSPADHSGIRPGDIIVAVGNQPVSTPHAVISLVQNALAHHQPPLLRILRDGQQLFVAVSPDSGDNSGDSGSDDDSQDG